MTLRSASLIAIAVAATAAPALAQDGYDPGPPPPLPAWEEELDDYPDEEYLEDEDGEEDAWAEPRGHYGPPPHARGYPPGHGAGAWGYHYPYPYPVMWVRVPIITERRDCGCETVVEEWIEEEPAPPRVRRAPPPRDKRIRVTK